MADYTSKYTGAEIDAGIEKANTALQSLPEHTHAQSDVTGLADALAGKSDTTHTHTAADVGALPDTYTPPVTSVNGKTGDVVIDTGGGTTGSVAWDNVTGKPETYPPDTHTHAQSEITGLTDALSGKADTSHTHAQGDVTGLTDALNGKANASHTHAYSEITGAPQFAYDSETQTLAINTTVG